MKNFIGSVLGIFTVTRRAGTAEDGHSLWAADCPHCGRECVATASNMRKAKSCGCLWKELISKSRTIHGGRGTPEYSSWSAMLVRCRNKSNKDYPRYGARGITVCQRWYKFESFLEDMGPRPSLNHSIERKDNSGPYSPGNCKWATSEEQANNRRSSKFLEVGGETLTVSQWAHRFGIDPELFRQRINRGWPISRASNGAVA